MCKILVVDDDPAVLKLFRIILEDLDYHAEFFSDPAAACARLQGSDFGEFGLMLTDYYMPGMNGLELIECIRKKARFAKMPILLVTSHDITIAEKELKEADVDQVSLKPFTTAGMKLALAEFDHLIARK